MHTLLLHSFLGSLPLSIHVCQLSILPFLPSLLRPSSSSSSRSSSSCSPLPSSQLGFLVATPSENYRVTF